MAGNKHKLEEVLETSLPRQEGEAEEEVEAGPSTKKQKRSDIAIPFRNWKVKFQISFIYII